MSTDPLIREAIYICYLVTFVYMYKRNKDLWGNGRGYKG